MKDIDEKIGTHWSRKTIPAQKKRLKLNWWQSPSVRRHINKTVCGDPVGAASEGFVRLILKNYSSVLPFKKGVSVGCGNGQKEMMLVQRGVVEHFDLYELSEERIAIGRELAIKKNLTQNVNFIKGNAFDIVNEKEVYDIVHWNNSLHHMLDVDVAVQWSRKVLKYDGLFCMDDYIGASRFQWPDEQLILASRVREIFKNSRYLINPNNPQKELPTQVVAPNKERLISMDPSEAADSEKIIDSINKYFPDASIFYTGGVIYHLALSSMFHNFDEEDDKMLLDLLMLVDELASANGQNHYGVALATKKKIDFL